MIRQGGKEGRKGGTPPKSSTHPPGDSSIIIMGGGASAVRDMEDIIACTFLISKAITSATFPGWWK